MILRKATEYEYFQWVRSKYNPNDPGLTLSYQFRLVGNIDVIKLNHVLNRIISEHFNSLLGYFLERDNGLYIGENVLPKIVLGQECEESLWSSRESIDPAGDKLFRFTYFIKETSVVLLKLEFSHLVFDGTCYKPFISLLSEYWCNNFTAQAALDLPTLHVFPPDADSLAYWRNALKGRRMYQRLPFCYKTSKGAGTSLSVKKTLTEANLAPISELLKRNGATLFQFIVAVTSAMVSCYENREGKDECVVIFYTVNSRRESAPYGCNTNLIPMFVNVDCCKSGSGLLNEIRLSREEVRAHQQTPTLQLMQIADARANLDARLLNLVVNCSDGLVPYDVPVLAGLDVDWVGKPDTGGPNELAINYSCDGRHLYISFDSSSGYISHEALFELAENFVRISSFMALKSEAPLSDCDLSRVLKPAISGIQNSSALDENILTRFSTVASRYMDELAVTDEQTVLTYREVMQAVHNMSSIIISLSQSVNTDFIGIFLERSVALPIALLSSLATQRTFVPMDPLLPDERLRYIVDTVNVQILLVDRCTKLRAEASFPTLTFIDVDEAIYSHCILGFKLVSHAPLTEAALRQPDKAAYVMFTSGSTGKPKAVAISERNLVNFLCSMENSLGLKTGEKMLALTSISFDISIMELLLPLVCGGSVHIISDETRVSSMRLGEAINHQGADIVQATPSTWLMLQQVGWRAAHPFIALCGGEELNSEVARYLLKQAGLIYHMYGPTEATIWASLRRVIDVERIFLGQPVLNSEFYIVNANGESVAPGMQGELVIAGACTGLGYLSTCSESSFVTLKNGIKAYKTGDIVRYLSPQDIEFVGRRDTQHKINGYRVDTTEISYRLKELEPTATVFTVVRKKPEPHLCSFLFIPEESSFDENKALAWCQRMLPYYMVPKAILRLSSIPLTTNGKVDLKLLSENALETMPINAPLRQSLQYKLGGIARIENIQLEIQKIVREKLDVSVLDFNQPLGWFGLNSISYNLLAVEFSKHFDIKLHSFEFYQYGSVNDIAEVIHQRINPENVISTIKNRSNSQALSNHNDRLAIVGLSVTMPGGKNAEDFWRSLLEKENCVRVAPRQRNMPGYYAGFLPNVKGFDARFFSISPLEATRMDPRQRLLMQAAWRTLENAGYAPSTLAGGRIGCYIAATGIDYALLQAREDEKQTPYCLSGHSLSMLSNRISAYFDWNGPSFTLDTACSGSLTALVKACRDLRAQVCDSAIVGGANLILDAQINQGLDAGRFMSPDQRCATFDESANGYVRGEGYGCFFVKRFSDAMADGDCIHAVIESVAENHGGKANSLTAPNPNAQYKLLLEAYTPELAQRVSYIETHGTGTRLGDPIEIAAIIRAWNELVIPESAQPIWLGAVKSNIGHLEPAAGIASVAKVIKALEYQTLPANLHFKRLTSNIDLTTSPFRILTETTPWIADAPLTAGVSAFGFGGVNAHVVLSAPPLEPNSLTSNYDFYLVPVSARSNIALRNNVAALAKFLEGHSNQWAEDYLLKLAYTLSCGREHFEHRQVWLVRNVDELLIQLYDHRIGVHTTPRRSLSSGVDIEYGEPGDRSTLLQIQSRYLEGVNIDWYRLYSATDAKRTHLPTYNFDEREYWFTKESSVLDPITVKEE
ncbi:MAG: beta-ketoacyl synthase N-terminal-like domain-containing protein [Yersinia sp. (in: enterobacteria)]